MRSRLHFFRAALIPLLSAAATCFGGEKIQFSAPSQTTEIAPKTRELPKGQNSILDSFSRGTPDFAPTPLPQTAAPGQKMTATRKRKRIGYLANQTKHPR